MQKKRIVIIGATSAIAQHCARLWLAESPSEFILVGRDQTRLENVATDLHLRGVSSTFRTIAVDVLDVTTIEQTANCIVKTGPVDIVLIAQGSLPVQSTCEKDLTHCSQALALNGMSPVLFAEAFAKHLAHANQGTLILIGSVAGDRAKKSNYTYGAAKCFVESYAQGLQHRFAKSNVHVILVKPGPTATPMTTHLQNQGIKLAHVEDVAKTVVKGIKKGTPVIYAPQRWRFIMGIIRLIPRYIFNQLPL